MNPLARAYQSLIPAESRATDNCWQYNVTLLIQPCYHHRHSLLNWPQFKNSGSLFLLPGDSAAVQKFLTCILGPQVGRLNEHCLIGLIDHYIVDIVTKSDVIKNHPICIRSRGLTTRLDLETHSCLLEISQSIFLATLVTRNHPVNANVEWKSVWKKGF